MDVRRAARILIVLVLPLLAGAGPPRPSSRSRPPAKTTFSMPFSASTSRPSRPI